MAMNAECLENYLIPAQEFTMPDKDTMMNIGAGVLGVGMLAAAGIGIHKWRKNKKEKRIRSIQEYFMKHNISGIDPKASQRYFADLGKRVAEEMAAELNRLYSSPAFKKSVKAILRTNSNAVKKNGYLNYTDYSERIAGLLTDMMGSTVHVDTDYANIKNGRYRINILGDNDISGISPEYLRSILGDITKAVLTDFYEKYEDEIALGVLRIAANDEGEENAARNYQNARVNRYKMANAIDQNDPTYIYMMNPTDYDETYAPYFTVSYKTFKF